MFGELYDEEWSEAFEDLSNKMQYSEDTVLQVLHRIVMMAFSFCHDMSETQVKDLESQMEHCMTLMTCVCNNQNYQVDIPDTDPRTHFSSANKLAREWRKSAALASVPSLCVIFKEHKMRESGEFKWNPYDMPNLNVYIDKCIELTWLMAVQQPKMHLTEAAPGDQLNKAAYRYYQQKGDLVKMTVWPALYLYQGGPIVSKGFIFPEKY
ncbi:hypothetical protein FSP39_017406 [Pinctada imbricata]|uniref:Mitochondria-eating protein C-terminal domain-containing protein n=1 Tax=Pinctada imbricata TaxID=66713 RepID=A0AA88YER8_PINIB|nr:hypothetical protein FSP39_017406 [Pinctada imbricata]